MRLSKSSRPTTFYESFSDLIFATMAIFVLVIIVLIILVQPKSIIETKSLEVVIAIDGSASMGSPLLELRNSIMSITEAVPLITPEFYLGILIFRSDNEELPMMQVVPEAYDEGLSLGKVRVFTDKLVPIQSITDISSAIEHSVQMYTNSERRKVLLIIGDVGPYEVTSNCKEIRQEEKALASLRHAIKTHPNMRVFSLYAKEGPRKACTTESEHFFRQLAMAAGPRGAYGTDDSKILAFLLRGVLGK